MLLIKRVTPLSQIECRNQEDCDEMELCSNYVCEEIAVEPAPVPIIPEAMPSPKVVEQDNTLLYAIIGVLAIALVASLMCKKNLCGGNKKSPNSK